MESTFVLPPLPYGYKDLEPYISETQLTIHHQKHHQSYVNNANNLMDTLQKARAQNVDLDMKSTLKNLSFNIGGVILHNLFWENLAPASSSSEPQGELKEAIEKEFTSLERFKKEFNQAAISIEGSGWAALTRNQETKQLLIMQLEKHNLNFYPGFEIVMVCDLWEHAYYLDYKNDRQKFTESFWKILNWKKVEERLKS